MKRRKDIGFDKQRGNFGCALSSTEKILASTNSVEILVARYKQRKNIGLDKQRGNFGCAFSSAEKIMATKNSVENSGGSL